MALEAMRLARPPAARRPGRPQGVARLHHVAAQTAPVALRGATPHVHEVPVVAAGLQGKVILLHHDDYDDDDDDDDENYRFAYRYMAL